MRIVWPNFTKNNRKASCTKRSIYWDIHVCSTVCKFYEFAVNLEVLFGISGFDDCWTKFPPALTGH